ncbi:ribosome-inactivating family protein, partial [Kitasatospora sp. NPDC057936]
MTNDMWGRKVVAELDIPHASAGKYSAFIESIVTHAGSPIYDTIRQARATRASETPATFAVRLTSGERRVDIHIRYDNLYLVGYNPVEEHPSTLYLLEERVLPPYRGLDPTILRMGVAYQDVERISGYSRSDMAFSREDMSSAVSDLLGQNDQIRARGVLRLAQMISEATRFRQIRAAITENWIGQGRRLPANLIDIQNNWRAISQAFHRALNDAAPRRQSLPVTVSGITFSGLQSFVAILAVAMAGTGSGHSRPRRSLLEGPDGEDLR